MNKKLIILLICILSCVSILNAQSSRQVLLRDGIVLRGAVGKLIGPDANDTCFFELDTSINNEGFVVEAGAKFEMLPSSTLEMMIADSKSFLPAEYQLWNAKITKYKGRNYIFPSIFIRANPPAKQQPLEEKGNEEPKPVKESKPEEILSDSSSLDVNDSLSLPPEVRESFEAARRGFIQTGQRIPDSNIVTIDTIQQEIEKKRKLNTDTILLDKPAILLRRGSKDIEFELDSFGQNIDLTSFRLLPCEVLEQTEAKQEASPEPLRFKISGLVTKYKGNNYLLLYKATQIYSYGNFPG